MTTMRGECKTPGGKLVAVSVTVDPASGRKVACRLDGDFFVEGDDAAANAMIADIERMLIGGGSGASVEPVPAEAVRTLIDRYAVDHGVRLVGTDAAAIATAYAWAIGDAGRVGGADAVGPAVAVRVDGHDVRDDQDTQDGHGMQDETERWRARWAALRPIVVHDVPRGPTEQMTVDERWAREVAAGARPATVRFWEWAGPAVVVGRFQSIPDEVHEDEAAREGIAIVRRCTGGGAMFIEPGNTITYSLYAPLPFVSGISIEESYRLCDQWLLDALRGIGVDARFAGLNDIASSHGKIGGAAQRRFPAPAGSDGPGAVLHHVTMAYDIDADKMMRILNTSTEKLSDKAVRSARKRVDPLRSQTGLERGAIVERLIAHLRDLGANAV
ncbi:lipoate--protein ligase family protein [Bifidobacterium amazonense]